MSEEFAVSKGAILPENLDPNGTELAYNHNFDISLSAQPNLDPFDIKYFPDANSEDEDSGVAGVPVAEIILDDGQKELKYYLVNMLTLPTVESSDIYSFKTEDGRDIERESGLGNQVHTRLMPNGQNTVGDLAVVRELADGKFSIIRIAETQASTDVIADDRSLDESFIGSATIFYYPPKEGHGKEKAMIMKKGDQGLLKISKVSGEVGQNIKWDDADATLKLFNKTNDERLAQSEKAIQKSNEIADLEAAFALPSYDSEVESPKLDKNNTNDQQVELGITEEQVVKTAQEENLAKKGRIRRFLGKIANIGSR